MRMFLIGMCDIFLLLYLTAIAEMESRPVSSLTVDDYAKLEISATEYRTRSERAESEALVKEQQLEAMRADLAANTRAATEAAERAEAVQSELARAAVERKALEQTAATERAEKEALERARGEASAREEQLRREISSVSERLEVTRAERERETERARQIALAVDEERSRREIEAQKAEAERKRAEEALAEAERERKAAEAAAARAAEAADREAEALRRAAEARKREGMAVEYAEKAVDAASYAHEDASRAIQRAASAGRERETVQERLAAVVRSAETAFTEHVAGALTSLAFEVKRDGAFGAKVDRFTLKSPAVRYDTSVVALVPLSQLGISNADEARAVRSIEVDMGGWAASRALVDPSARVLAVLVPSTTQSVGSTKSSDVGQLTPTLLAVRNGARRGLGDRIRSLSDEHVLVNRDRLSATSPGLLTYRAEGFRGTGDFGEQLLPGDHLLDVTGAYLGLTITENVVRTIPSVTGWQEVALGESSDRIGDALARRERS